MCARSRNGGAGREPIGALADWCAGLPFGAEPRLVGSKLVNIGRSHVEITRHVPQANWLPQANVFVAKIHIECGMHVHYEHAS